MTASQGASARTYLVREVALGFLLAGVAIHVISILKGLDFLRQYVLTPTTDLLLGGAIVYTAVGLALTFRRYDLSRHWRKAVYVVLILFCLAEIPVHVTIQATRSTAVLASAPPGYDYVAIPLLSLFALFVATLKRKTES